MSRIQSLLLTRVAEDATVANMMRPAVFALSPIVFLLGVQASTRVAQSEADLLIGVVCTSTLAIALTVLGHLLPRPAAAPHA